MGSGIEDLPICVAVEARNGELLVDFTGTAGQVMGGVQRCPLGDALGGLLCAPLPAGRGGSPGCRGSPERPAAAGAPISAGAFAETGVPTNAGHLPAGARDHAGGEPGGRGVSRRGGRRQRRDLAAHRRRAARRVRPGAARPGPRGLAGHDEQSHHRRRDTPDGRPLRLLRDDRRRDGRERSGRMACRASTCT